jgi:hypothetical protein
MQLSTLFIIYAAWCLLRGTGFIFSPVKLWKGFNVNLDKHTAFPVQILGAAFIATAIMNWTAKNAIGNSLVQSIVLFNFANELIGTLITIYGISRNAINKIAWLPFIFHLLFGIAFGYYLFSSDQ